jgi:hypothetical protein
MEAPARELLARERRRVESALADLTRRENPGELSQLDQHPADYATELFDEELEQGWPSSSSKSLRRSNERGETARGRHLTHQISTEVDP